MKIKSRLFLFLSACICSSCIVMHVEDQDPRDYKDLVFEEREIEETYWEISSNNGFNVYLTYSTSKTLKIQAEESVLSKVDTYVKDGVLTIIAGRNIRSTKPINIYVPYTNLNKISASTNSHLFFESPIKSNTLLLKASTGSVLNIPQVEADHIIIDSRTKEINIAGRTRQLEVKASGADLINAEKLVVDNCEVHLTNHSNLIVQVLHSIKGYVDKESSIEYGSPKKVNLTKEGRTTGEPRR